MSESRADELLAALAETVSHLGSFAGYTFGLEETHQQIKSDFEELKGAIDTVESKVVSTAEPHARRDLEKQVADLRSGYKKLLADFHAALLLAKRRAIANQAAADRQELLRLAREARSKQRYGSIVRLWINGRSQMSSPADALADDVSHSFKRMQRIMQEEIERSASNIGVLGTASPWPVHHSTYLETSSRTLHETHGRYQMFGGLLDTSRLLVRDIHRRDSIDKALILAAFVLYLLVVVYVVYRRVWLPKILTVSYWLASGSAQELVSTTASSAAKQAATVAVETVLSAAVDAGPEGLAAHTDL